MRKLFPVVLLAISASFSPAAAQSDGPAFRRAQLAAIIHRHGAQALDTAKVRRRLSEDTALAEFIQSPFDPDVPVPSLQQLEAMAATVAPTGRVALGYDGPVAIDSVLNSVGQLALHAPAIVFGITDFFVARAKDEVAFAFVYNLREPANQRFARAALPRSAALVSTIEVATFHSLVPALRSAFTADLETLPGRLRNTDVLDSIGIDTSHRATVQGLALLYAKGVELRAGRPPVAVVASLYDIDPQELSNENIRRGLVAVGAVGREYAAGGESILADLLQSNNGMLRRYFVAFLARDLITRFALDSAAGRTYLEYMSNRESDIVMLIRHLRSIEENAAAVADSLGDVSRDRLGTLAARTLQAAGAAQGLIVSPEDARVLRTWLADAERLTLAVAGGDYFEVVTWLVTLPGVQDSAGAPQLRLLSLAGALASASTPEEASAALESVSSPVGSYRAKRSQDGNFGTPRTVSIVGYLGATGGLEDDDGLPDFNDAGHAGPSLPIGIEGSIGVPGGALSLFLSLIDVGTLASTRFAGGDDISSTPQVGLQQVFAPGVFLVYNATRSLPLSIGLGLQSVSSLRERDGADGDEDVSITRVSAFIGIDATLFHFSF